MILAILIVLVSIAVKLWHDLRVHFKNVKNGTAIGINHAKEAWFMAIANIPSLILLTMHSSLRWYFGGPLSFFLILFTVWNLFDGFYAIGKRESWWYVGSPDNKGRAKTDNVLQSLSLWQHVAVKIGGLGVLVGTYVCFS